MTIDLRRMISPDAVHVFLKTADGSFCFQIVQIQSGQVFFTSDHILEEQILESLIAAGDEQGVLQIECPEIKLIEVKNINKKDINKKDIYLYSLSIKSSDFSITNRRHSKRIRMRELTPVRFIIFGETVQAAIENISEGGVRLATSIPIKKNMHCSLIFKFHDSEGGFHFMTDGVVVYSVSDRQPGSVAHLGIHFVTPFFDKEEDRVSYRSSLERFKNFLTGKAG